MLLHNSSEWSKSKPFWLGIAVCFLLTAFATLFRIAIHDLVQPNLPFQIFYISVILTTYYFGWILGLLGCILATACGFYFFIAPYDSFAIPSISDCFVVAVNIITMMFCVLAIEYLQRSSYASAVLLKASKNNYRLYIRSENHLINVKKDIAQHEKLIRAITSKEDIPLLWADPYEVICYFEMSNEFIPPEVLIKSDRKFINLFLYSHQALILNNINTSLSENTIVEFSFLWSTNQNNGNDLIGRITPILIDQKKSIVFSVAKK